MLDKPFKRLERGTAIFIRVTNDIGAVNQQDKMLIAVRCVSRLDQGAVRGSVLEGRVDRGVEDNVLNDIYSDADMLRITNTECASKNSSSSL